MMKLMHFIMQPAMGRVKRFFVAVLQFPTCRPSQSKWLMVSFFQRSRESMAHSHVNHHDTDLPRFGPV
jgi:hypothetical protein